MKNENNTFFRAGLIEAGGRGIQKIASECQVVGLPVPEYRYDISKGKRHRTRIARMTRMHTDTIYRFSQLEENKRVKYRTNRKEIFGSKLQNPRVSAQSAASAFPFRFDEYYFIEMLKQKYSSNPYNPDIANAFFRAGLIEAWGRGIQKIARESEIVGLPAPEYRYELAETIGVTTCSIERNIQNLQQKGKLVRIGSAKGGHWKIIRG